LNQELRKKLQAMVVKARRLLEDDIWGQLEGTYGISASRKFEETDKVAGLSENPRLAQERAEIEAAIRHEATTATNGKMSEAVARFVRETAFTHLNRLAAFKIMEHRKLIKESVGQGLDSEGFRIFQQVCPEYCRTAPDRGYQRYLQLLCDEVSTSVRVLFDQALPHSIIFPSQATLKALLELLNDSELAGIWPQEETIGWIYQYFTPKELREKAHKESPHPRNSYELAFLNQFYTPAYVVRFLTDNTLGRLWYEIRRGDTRLADQCAYMVRRLGETTPEWPARDPRSIRVLDPACGSGHFLLYAFDLLATMYEEEGYPKHEIPGLILEHNLYGIDIDLRATQITALALYLKALGYHREASIEKLNIVCAEPMPGNRELFKEFLSNLQSPTLERIAQHIWTEMELAGEAGSLLKPDEKLRRIIARERTAWEKRPEGVQLGMWGTGKAAQLDFSDVTDEMFWVMVENRLLQHLADYADTMANGRAVSRRLFAHDGVQGIRFLEVLRQSYDVVLMNPPFGAPSKPSKAYVDENYPLSKNDVYAAFVEKGLGMLRPGGRLGAITSRTGFFLSSFQKWREQVLLKKATLTVMADLGAGVLDTAMVETAAYCLEVAD